MHQLFVSDVLVLKSLNYALEENVRDQLEWCKRDRPAVSETERNIAELLQQSAFEHLTTFRHLKARDFGSVATIVTSDFEALYAYKHGDYQQCLQLSTQNVHTLLYAVRMTDVVIPVFIQLMDDDIVSLTALTVIVNPRCTCRCKNANVAISQLTLSLYLMTQCQLKLRHSVTSMDQTLNYIKVAQRRHPVDYTLNHLTLKLSKYKIVAHLRMTLNSWYK